MSKGLNIRYTLGILMQITTIKLNQRTKINLEKLKERKDSYDDIVNRLILQDRRLHLKEELISAYKSLNNSDLKILEEWEYVSSEV